jgi:hypothetical protein
MDAERLNDATEALNQFQRTLDYLFDRDSVSPFLKAFFLDLVDLVPERRFARHLVVKAKPDRVHEPDEWGKKFLAELSDLERQDPAAYEASFDALKLAIVASILQWPETAEHLTSLFVRFASQKKLDAVYSAAEGRRRVQHDKQFGDAPAYA